MKKMIAILKIYLVISIILIFGYSENAYAAGDEITSCCKKAENGQSCVDGLTQEQCQEGYAGGVRCENVNECRNRGCCKVNGDCVTGALEGTCYGEYYNDAECNVEQCRLKCCVAGNSCGLMSEEKCQGIGGTVNEALDIDSCNQVCETKSKGCCKTGEGCSYVSGESCSGQFFTNQACTRVSGCSCNNDNPATGCVENDLYNYDSCGNPTLKERCNTAEGKLCSDKNNDGKFACEDMNCKIEDNPYLDENSDGILNNDGKIRKNGEAWCAYQSAVGSGLDLPGTSHYLHSCINGKEEVKMCGNGNRDEICIYSNPEESTLKESQGSRAICVENNYQECLACNSDENLNDGETKAGCCEKAGLCYWAGLNEDTEIKGSQQAISFNFLLPENANSNLEGEIQIFDKKIIGRLSEVKLLFINNKDKIELTKSLSEASTLDKQKLGNKVSYNYELKLNLEKPVKEIMNINITQRGKSEFLSSIQIEPTIKQEGSCLPFVPPGNIAIKTAGRDTYSGLIEKAEDECALGNSKIATIWERDEFDDDWECTKNCNTYPENDKSYMNNQNFLCGTYGDCGAKWNIVEKWSSEGYYFECGSSPELKGKYEGQECERKKYYIDTPPNELNFTIFKYSGKGIVADIDGIDYMFSIEKTTGEKVFDISKKSVYTYSLIILTLNPFTLVGGAILSYYQLPLIFGEDVKRRHSSTHCEPWEPPLENECWRCHALSNETVDNKNCDYASGKCGLLPVINNKIINGYECTPQMCSSLGKDCLWQDSNLGARCVEQKERDVISPIIKIKSAEYECQTNECRIENTNNPSGVQQATQITGEIKPGHKLAITIETRNPTDNGADLTKCRHTFNAQQEYNDMIGFDDGLGFEHKIELNSLADGEYNIYFACEDITGNENKDKYSLKFKVAQYPDISAPIIFEARTLNGIGTWNRNAGQRESAYIANNTNYAEVELILNEQANCRWTDINANINYEQMSGNMICEEPESITEPYSCKTQLNAENEKIIWFRCADLKDNKNLQSVPLEGYRIKKTTGLEVAETKCISTNNEKCEGTINDNQITLQLMTEGGTEGNANCKWDPGTGYVDFLEGQGTVLHKQPGINLKSGDNKIEYTCEDKAGNLAGGTLKFNAEKDTGAPVILKIYQSENQLSVNTNENALCKYSTNKTFDFNTEDVLSKDNTGMIHTISIDNTNRYFKIGCIDRYENKAGPFEVYVNK